MNHASLLVMWYANPLDVAESARLALQAEQRLQQRPANRYSCFINSLMQLIANWWSERFDRHDLERAFIDANSRRQLALGHLVVGQLLISRKMSGAMAHLDKGLYYADGLIKPGEYFLVYNRHEDLRSLLLSREGQPPHTLEVLLNEARVIRRLNRHNAGLEIQDWPEEFSIP